MKDYKNEELLNEGLQKRRIIKTKDYKNEGL